MGYHYNALLCLCSIAPPSKQVRNLNVHTAMDSDDEFVDVFPKKAAAKIATSQELKELESAWQLSTSHAEVALAKDKKHYQMCKKKSCTRCSYVTRGSELAKVTRMFEPDVLRCVSVPTEKLKVANGCWLASATVDGNWGLGCIVCCANGLPGPFATFT